MLPIKHQSIFKSRWIAMLWAAGIIWSAVEFTGGQAPADTNNDQAASDGSTPPATDGGDAAVSALTGAINTLQGMR